LDKLHRQQPFFIVVKMTTKQSPEEGNKLGLLLVDKGFITSEQLHDALRLQRKAPATSPDYKYLGQILVEQKLIDPQQLQFVMQKYSKKSRLGDILIRCNAITEPELKIALSEQRKSGERLGTVLLKKGMVSDETMRQALSTQLNIPYIDISRLNIDSNLTKIINRDYALKHKIIPISMTDTSITLAMDDPTNTDVASELEMFTRLKVNIVTSSQSAIKGAFNRLYPDEIRYGHQNGVEYDHHNCHDQTGQGL